jgi:glycosyltransferase involved in cell wall biosynthesis
MRIGFDAKWFFDGNPSGKVVVRNLIKELTQNINDDNYFYIFLDKRNKGLEFPYKSKKIKIIYVWAGINALSNIFVLPLLAIKYNIDVFLFQYFTPFFGKFKKIVYIHDCIFKSHPEYFSFLEKIYYLPIKPLSYFADNVITVSNSEKERLIKYSFAKDPSHISVVYNGYSSVFKTIEHFDSTLVQKTVTKFNLPGKYLLYVGRLNQRKNILNLIKSINMLHDKDIKLVIVGKPQQKMFNLSSAIKNLGISDRIILLNYVEDSLLPIVYGLATIFCYVSFQEGFGLPPLEAMAAGVPVIVSNTSSLPEICGHAGTYCNPFDSKDIANKIDTLLEDKNVYLEKKRLGFSIASQFKWEKAAKDILNIMNNLYYKN